MIKALKFHFGDFGYFKGYDESQTPTFAYDNLFTDWVFTGLPMKNHLSIRSA
jgi:hypothetical protein